MVKKILLSLLIFIIVIVLGILSLVMFVDPNNFRGFISDTVKDKTGYELTIEGNLRWHIWPQISILTDSVRLQDEGAKKAILTADNMRLDVELLPLFYKDLVVKNVLVKSAVINLTDDSKGNVANGHKTTATVNKTKTQTQTQTQTKQDNSNQVTIGWSFTLNQLDIVSSTIVYQQNKDIISFRDIDISISQKDDKNVAVNLSGSINRNQQDFVYSLNADVNLAHFPQSANVNLHSLNYDYKGVGVPAGQLKGEISATFNYQQSPLMLDSQDFILTVNDNQFKGQLRADLDKKPYFEALLKSDKFDISPFLAKKSTNNQSESSQSSQSQPVVSSKKSDINELAFLQNFDAKFNLMIDKVIMNNVTIDNFIVDADNKDGIATLNKVNLDIADGHIVANGLANGKQAKSFIQLATKVDAIDLGMLFSQLDIVNNFQGIFNANGNITTDTINPDAITQALAGDLSINVTNARMDNLNIQRIVQEAITQFSKESVTSQQYQKYTELEQISANAKIANGNMNLSSLQALSETLNVTGDGQISLIQQTLDMNLLVKMLSGWNGDSKTIQKLQNIAIPVRIYGPFNELHYRADAGQLIKDALSNKIQNQLDKLKERLNDNSSDDSDSNSSSDTQNSSGKTKAKDILGGLLNKIK